MGVKKIPDALFVIDSRKEKIAVNEAKKMKIPIISLSNTDCNIKEVNYPILGNDASASSIKFFVNEITKTYKDNLLD